jgi:hypothetical protein
MVGDIAAPRVIIVDGASFRGRIDMGEVDVDGERPARPASRPLAAAARPALKSARAAGEAKKVEEKAAAPAAPARPPAPPAPVAMGAVKRKVIVKRK